MIEPSTEVKKGPNYEIWQSGPIEQAEFQSKKVKDQLLHLISCAHRAPSSHNTQPWAYRINENPSTIEIFLDRGEYGIKDEKTIDKRRVLPASDTHGRQACISVGCALANLRYSALHFGFNPVISFAEIHSEFVKPLQDDKLQNARYVSLAHITFESLTEQHPFEDLYSAIFTRRMNRGKYESGKFIEEDLINLMLKTGEINDISVKLLSRKKMTDRLIMQALAELQGTADTVVVNFPAFTQELGNWLLPNDTPSFLGMPGDTFGLQQEQSLHFHKGLIGEVDLKADDKAGLSRGGKEGIESASLIGMLLVPQDAPNYWIKAGMALGGITLIAEKNGLSLSMHAGLAEVSIVGRALSASVRSNQKLVSLFRIGYSKDKVAKPHSPRLPVEQVVL